MATETRYCAGTCHEFTEHERISNVSVDVFRCTGCRHVATCSNCGAHGAEGHRCPPPPDQVQTTARLYCGYCCVVRGANYRENGNWKCEYCGDWIACQNCRVRWKMGHRCGEAEQASGAMLYREIEITIGPGVQLPLATLGASGESRVRALAPRLHAGPTYREPVERALLAMDRALREGNESLALDLLNQAEILAGAG